MRAPIRFPGFHPETFRFFRRLARHNHKPWFDRNRDFYREHVAGGLKRLFENLVPVMMAHDPDFEISGKTGRNFSRINPDIRFARDKSPYRRNFYLYFGPHGSVRLDTRLYVGLSADGVTCGFAAYNGRESSLSRLLKPRRVRDPKELESAIGRLSRKYEMYWHCTEQGKWARYPGPPRSEKDWKRCRAWVVRKRFSQERKLLFTSGFGRKVEQIFRELFPLYAFTAIEGRPGERALKRARQRW